MSNGSNQSREKKRAQFSEAAQPNKKLTPVLVAVLLALIGVGAYLVIGASGEKPASTQAPSAPQTATGGDARDMRIPLAELSAQAKFFDYKLTNNKPIRFFAMKSSDGVYRAALDACDVCYHAKKGYHQEGDDMVCNNCRQHFHSSLINEVSGGCNPVGLPRAVEGDYLVIKASELESRGQYF
jgi:uncharacterized membrane protein